MDVVGSHRKCPIYLLDFLIVQGQEAVAAGEEARPIVLGQWNVAGGASVFFYSNVSYERSTPVHAEPEEIRESSRDLFESDIEQTLHFEVLKHLRK